MSSKSSDEQEEIQERGSEDNTSKQADSGYIFVSKKKQMVFELLFYNITLYP